MKVLEHYFTYISWGLVTELRLGNIAGAWLLSPGLVAKHTLMVTEQCSKDLG